MSSTSVSVRPCQGRASARLRPVTGVKACRPWAIAAKGTPAAPTPGANAIPIRGLGGDLPVRFAPECGAVPGDRIVGIMDRDKGITIYPIQSPSLQKFDEESERWIDVRWDLDEANNTRFMARIQINALNEPGTLAEIAQAIATSDINPLSAITA